MKDMYKVVVDYTPSQADNAVVSEGIIASNEHITRQRIFHFSEYLEKFKAHLARMSIALLTRLCSWAISARASTQ